MSTICFTNVRLLLWGPWVLLLLGLTNLSLAENPSAIFRAGAAIADITPTELPVNLVGGFLPILAHEVEDPLFARALVLDDGKERFAFLVIDNCVMPDELHEQIKAIIHEQTGLAINRICISMTHNHSSPPLTGAHSVVPDERYIKTFPPRAAEAVIQAVARLQPVQIACGKIREPRYVFCRRFLMAPGTAATIPSAFTGIERNLAQMNPGRLNPNAITRLGVPDQNLYLMAFRSLEGKPVALLANYSTHYAQGGTKVSADYFGVFAHQIAKLLEAPSSFVAMMTNGTSADNNCIDFLKKEEDQPYNRQIVGTHLAEDALALWQQLNFVDWVPLTAMESEITLKIRRPSESDVAEAKAWLDQLKQAGKEIRTVADVYANETIIDADLPPERSMKIQAIRIGSLGIIALPNEVFSWTGHDIRANSLLEPTFVISLANGYHGYLPTVESFELGGYTTWRTRSSILEREAEPKVRAEALRLLRQISEH